MKRAILIIATIVLLGGVAHISLGLAQVVAGGLTLNLLWFMGSGLSLIYIAFVNYLVITVAPGQTRMFVPGHITNILGSVLLGVILLKLPAPHVALLFLLVLTEMVLLIWSHIKVAKSSTPHSRSLSLDA